MYYNLLVKWTLLPDWVCALFEELKHLYCKQPVSYLFDRTTWFNKILEKRGGSTNLQLLYSLNCLLQIIFHGCHVKGFHMMHALFKTLNWQFGEGVYNCCFNKDQSTIVQFVHLLAILSFNYCLICSRAPIYIMTLISWLKLLLLKITFEKCQTFL